jgi:hypothetical protein
VGLDRWIPSHVSYLARLTYMPWPLLPISSIVLRTLAAPSPHPPHGATKTGQEGDGVVPLASKHNARRGQRAMPCGLSHLV